MQAFRCVQPTHLRPCLHFLTGFHVLTFTNIHNVALSTGADELTMVLLRLPLTLARFMFISLMISFRDRKIIRIDHDYPFTMSNVYFCNNWSAHSCEVTLVYRKGKHVYCVEIMSNILLTFWTNFSLFAIHAAHWGYA